MTVADRIVDASQEPGQTRALRAAGLFAGIGGIELGLGRARHTTEFFCEIDPYAQAVLRARFPRVDVTADIRDLTALPATVDLVTAGFPCQDLSQAGRTAGIGGRNSGLVGHVLDLLAHSDSVQWVVFENVPFMLHLDHGGAMAYLVDRLEALGFSWAYRVVDTRAFGLPQRRQRVVMIASRELDPCSVLLADDDAAVSEPTRGTANGFYWTEGLRGLGWAVDAVPTLKGGSTIGIPSPPAIWMRDGAIATPDIRDAERLQGFPVDWTLPAMAEAGSRRGTRWKLIGNAVTVPMAEWVGTRLSDPGTYDGSSDRLLPDRHRWPRAAWGRSGDAYMSTVSDFPVRRRFVPLSRFLEYELSPLSIRAAAGFLSRARRSSLRFPPGLIDAIEEHLARSRADRNGA